LSADTLVKHFFAETFPNDNNEFTQFEKDYSLEIKAADNGIDDDVIIASLIWSVYLARKHPHFALNKEHLDSLE